MLTLSVRQTLYPSHNILATVWIYYVLLGISVSMNLVGVGE